MIYRVEKYILNFFFGKVLNEPISFDFTFNELKDINGDSANICFRLKNNSEIFPVEKDFAEFNSISLKQEVGHNFHAAVHTGNLEVAYSRFKIEDSYLYTETVNLFLQNFISYLLTFFQRRRVIIGIVNLKCDKPFFSFPPFLAGEIVDSIGYGEPLIPYDKTDKYLNESVKCYAGLDYSEKTKIEGLLVRYNETLNLPYTYERSESFWRIIESLSDINLNSNQQIEYDRIKNLIGIRNNRESNNLKKFIKTLVDYGIKYADQDVKDAFIFRNYTIHEYLNINKINSAASPFLFLNKCVEIIIISLLKIDKDDYMEPSFTIVQNRVL